jgi:hypothetical protein
MLNANGVHPFLRKNQNLGENEPVEFQLLGTLSDYVF